MAKYRIGKYTVYNLAEFRAGGVAFLDLGVLGSGHKVIYRYLQSKYKFKLRMRRKFRKGIKIRERLGRHPNVVWTLDSGSKDFTPFELIDYVNGPNLQVALSTNAEYAQKHALLIMYQVAQAVSHIHSSGYLHLDLKANNVILDMTGVRPVARVTDFDLSLPMIGLKPDKKLRYGTYNYMAPEQLTIGRMGPESDVFAYGVLAYNLFTSKMPYLGESAAESRRYKTDPNYKVPRVREFYPDLDERLEDVIMCCLEPHVERRYSAVKFIVRDLREIIGADVVRGYDETSTSTIL